MTRPRSTVKQKPDSSKLSSGLARLGMTYKEYLQSDHWKRTKERYYAVRKRECWVCGTDRQIDLHHKTYDNIGRERIPDLVPLCRLHHGQFHQENGIADLKRSTGRFVKHLSRDHLPCGMKRIMNGKIQARVERKNGRGAYRQNFMSVEKALKARNRYAPKIKPRDGGKSEVARTDGPPCRNCATPMYVMRHPAEWKPASGKGYYAFWWLCHNDMCKTTLVMPSEGYVRG